MVYAKTGKEKVFPLADSDGDGTLSAVEALRALPAGALARLDADADGRVAVLYGDGSQYSVRPANLVRVFAAPVTLFACFTTSSWFVS